MKKRFQYFGSILFLFILLLPTMLIFVLKESDDVIKNENRKRSQCPKLDIRHLDKFPVAFNNFYNDNFSLRPLGVKLYNRFNYFFLKKSPDETKGIVGKENWIFQGKDLDYYRGLTRLSIEDQSNLKNELMRRAEFLKKINCRFLLVIIPSKSEIYQEFIPEVYFKYSKKTATDQILNLIKQVNGMDVIDLRPVLINAKSKYPEIYHRYDHHWNDYGSFVAYDTIIGYTQLHYKTSEKHNIDNYQEEVKESKDGSLAVMLGIEDKISFYRYYLTPKFNWKTIQLESKYRSPERFPYPYAFEKRFQHEDQSLPRLFMVNDSFGEYLYQNLAEHFSYSTFLFDNWEYNLHVKKLVEEKPDLYIISAYESFIPHILENIQREENQVDVP